MIIWRTDKPDGDTILAKLVPSWRPRYAVLYWSPSLQMYYDDTGEEVPFSAIQQWETIESTKEENL